MTALWPVSRPSHWLDRRFPESAETYGSAVSAGSETLRSRLKSRTERSRTDSLDGV